MITHRSYTVEPWAVRETSLNLDVLAQSALADPAKGLRDALGAATRAMPAGGRAWGTSERLGALEQLEIPEPLLAAGYRRIGVSVAAEPAQPPPHVTLVILVAE